MATIKILSLNCKISNYVPKLIISNHQPSINTNSKSDATKTYHVAPNYIVLHALKAVFCVGCHYMRVAKYMVSKDRLVEMSLNRNESSSIVRTCNYREPVLNNMSYSSNWTHPGEYCKFSDCKLAQFVQKRQSEHMYIVTTL